MRKAMNFGCWSCFPSREESMLWGVAGVLLAAVVTGVVVLL